MTTTTSKQPQVWFTSDLHFFHANIIKYCKRPFSTVEEMNEALISNWNAVVDADDDVYVLGDVVMSSLQNAVSILSRLNGNIHVVLGNHDKVIRANSAYLIDNGLIKSIDNYLRIYINKQHICLFHFACRVWDQSHRGSWMLYGHSHGTLTPKGLTADVGVDSTDILGFAPYRPLSFTEISEYMSSQASDPLVS